MHIESIDLLDFRNYQQAEASFVPGLNLVLGRNGQGKTNLLEAVHLLSTLGSHRATGVGALVRHDQERSIIRARGVSKGRAVSVDAEVKRAGGVRLLVNKVPLERSHDAGSVLSAVLFSPEDLALTKGGPEERRRFVDHAAARLRPLAAAERQEFERVLRQRNGVLKASLANPRALRQLDVWTEQLVKSGSVVVRNRLSLLDKLTPVAQSHYTKVAGSGEPPGFRYEASWSEEPPVVDIDLISERIRLALEEAAASELHRGLTLVGPHRDDVAIELGGQDARAYASQGEQRSLALSLRLAERDLVAEARGQDPILLLDDVFSELDDSRRAQLAELTSESGQTIATSTSAEGLPFRAGQTLWVDEGKVLQHE